MARLTLILSVLATVVALLGGFRWLMGELRDWNWRRKQTGRWLMVLVVGLLPLWSQVDNAHATCTGASPTWTCTGTTGLFAEMNSLMNSGSPAGFARNDTITVTTTGTHAQSAFLSVTKGVTITMPGRDSLTLTNSSGFISIVPDSTAITNEETIKVTGFTFDGLGVTDTFLAATGAGVSAAKPFKNLVIGDFRMKDSVTTATEILAISGQTRGVIYNGIFDRVNILATMLAGDSQTEWENAAYPQVLGTADNLYFEDITFQCSTSFSGVDAGWMESGHASRYIVRYSTWNYLNCSTPPRETFDVHGSQFFPGGQWGTMVSEFYGVKIINAAFGANFFRPMNFRGGWGRLFNNSLQHTGNAPAWEINQYDGCQEDTPGTADTEVKNLYNWNIRRGNPPTTQVNMGIGLNSCGLAENTDWWNENASCAGASCTAGIGKGTSVGALPTTCTVGTGFYVASDTSATLDWALQANKDITQASKLYKCTSTDTWTLDYQPYTYPHPLRNEAVAAPAVTALSPAIWIASVATLMVQVASILRFAWERRTLPGQVARGAWRFMHLLPNPYDLYWIIKYRRAVRRWLHQAPTMLQAPQEDRDA